MSRIYQLPDLNGEPTRGVVLPASGFYPPTVAVQVQRPSRFRKKMRWVELDKMALIPRSDDLHNDNLEQAVLDTLDYLLERIERKRKLEDFLAGKDQNAEN